jgi:predicted MFS family arabinose efflux permease
LNGIYGWLAEASGEQKRTLLAAFLGYMLDSMDVMLYALVLGQVQRELHLSAAMSGAMVSATLIAAAAGGVGFGRFADRFGRVRALIWSVLVYSIGTALCGFSQTAGQLMLCRVLLGLGMGGEWASGAALVAETWPRQGARAGAKRMGGWLRTGRGRGRSGDATLRVARRFLRRNSPRLDFPVGAARAARTGSLAPRAAAKG